MSFESELMIYCDLLLCKGYFVSVMGIYLLEGIVDKVKEEYNFKSFEVFESFFVYFIIVNMLWRFSFCFFRCKMGCKKYVLQILIFLLLLELENLEFLLNKKEESFINVNIVVLDFVLCVYFYCFFFKMVSIFRNIVYNEFIKVIVLDFELLQSLVLFMFYNI